MDVIAILQHAIQGKFHTPSILIAGRYRHTHTSIISPLAMFCENIEGKSLLLHYEEHSTRGG